MQVLCNVNSAGIIKYNDIIEEDTWVLQLMFGAYMITGNFILLNLFISVINESLAAIHSQPETSDYDEELGGYIQV